MSSSSSTNLLPQDPPASDASDPTAGADDPDTPPASTSDPPPPSSTSTPPPESTPQPPPESTPPTTTTPTTTPPASTPTEQPTQPPDSTSTEVVVVTRTPTVSQPGATTGLATTSTAPPTVGSNGDGGSAGLSSSAKIAIAVVVPIAGVALLVFAAIFWYRRRKARKEAEEERRKEVEDYAYNPNADPTIPAVGLVSDDRFEMREDGGSGYRGWGSTTAAGSTGRKASTTLSGGGVTGEPLIDGSHHSGSYSPEGEILGQMGPPAAQNREIMGNLRRGPSNASSSYSAAGRSDTSGDVAVGMAYGNGNNYYNQYAGGNPYADPMYNDGPQQGGMQGGQPMGELPGQPVIRDNPARRNTRIENPSHYPQQSAGISQNF